MDNDLSTIILFSIFKRCLWRDASKNTDLLCHDWDIIWH